MSKVMQRKDRCSMPLSDEPQPVNPPLNPPNEQASHRRLTAFLAAMAFFLSTVEYMLPRPIPFMRLGLANIPILFAVDLLPLPWYLLLALVKVLGMSVLTGSLFSYIALFSLAGTMTSALAMRLVRRVARHRISLIGLCVAGAVSSNLVQVLLARLLVFGQSARYMLPAFLGLGLVSGLALGFAAQRFSTRSAWLARVGGQHGQSRS